MTTSTTAPLGQPEDTAAAEEPPVREVVVGVDGSEVGLAAVRWAAREAVRRGAPLRILHAAPYFGRHRSREAHTLEVQTARRITAQAYTVARHTGPAVQAATEIVPDDPTSTLLLAAADSQLVVLGSSATGAADEMVLASVAVRVAARSPRPVVVVPRQRPGNADSRPAVAVLGVGDREDDDVVAAFAAEEARRFGVGLTVLQTRPPRRAVADNWADDLDEWGRRYPDLSVTHRALPAPRADQLLAGAGPSPLIVISAGHGTLLHRALDGPHLWLLRHCTSPMALVPPAQRLEQDRRGENVALG